MVAGVLQRGEQRLNVGFSAANLSCSMSDNGNAHRYTTEILASDCGDSSLRVTVEGLSRLVPMIVDVTGWFVFRRIREGGHYQRPIEILLIKS